MTIAAKNSIAWITGASSGIGESLARAHLAVGGSCILSGRNVEALERVAQDSASPDRCLILPFDTGDFEILPDMVERATDWQGRVDILINNAGLSQRSLAIDTELSVYDRIIDIDLRAPIALTQALLPHLLEQGSGRVIMISSVAGKVGVPMRTAYCAAKHGLIGYSDALRSEVAGQGIKILVVTPGSVRTNVSRNALSADGSVRGVSDKAIDNGIDPDEVARLIWAAAAKGARELLIAKGMEADLPKLRAHDPERLFDMVEDMVAKGYAQKMKAES